MTADKPRQVKDMEKVKNILGKGNSAGEVYMVQDKGTGRDYALKTVISLMQRRWLCFCCCFFFI